MKKISSIQNSYIKNLIKLQEKSRERKKLGLFLVEGKREIELAIKGNYKIETILFVPVFFSETSINNEFPNPITKIEITREVYKKLAYRNTTEGIIAIVKSKKNSLNKVKFENKNPLILVLEAIEKPGNIGAILRTADAAKVDAVFIANAKTDIYNPNIIRSSVGCLFTNQIVVASSEEVINYLKEKNITIYSTTLQNSNEYYKEDFTKASAIIVGTEALGLSQVWRNDTIKSINIPMQGQIDSMNVSVACAIITFEAKRQRNFL